MGQRREKVGTESAEGALRRAHRSIAVRLRSDGKLGLHLSIVRVPELAEKRNTTRSRHIPTWMYFRTVERIDRWYGQGANATFFAAADVQIIFRLNDRETGY